MYFTRTPAWLKHVHPALVWSVPTKENVIYLTFDDGPTPIITPWVLDTLEGYNAKATFFCVGRNVAQHPEIHQRTIDAGHSIGNHTWDHVNGWRTADRNYLRSVLQCQRMTGTDLFRPPYGRIKPSQLNALKKRFRVVMWDVLSADHDKQVGAEQCMKNVIDQARPGSIIVFHDSAKAAARMQFALPRVLEHFAARGYKFGPL